MSDHRKFLMALWLIALAACSTPDEPAEASTQPAREDGLVARYRLDAEKVLQWKMPAKLKEISGLALAPDGRLFGHTDEAAVIYEFDYENGRQVKAFAFGEPSEKGDFEGITFLDEHFYLVTSEGMVYVGEEGGDRERMPFERYDARTRDRCAEIEGLTHIPQTGELVLACKEPRKKEDKQKVLLFYLATTSLGEPARVVEIDAASVIGPLGLKRLSPSGIIYDPARERFVVIASRESAIFELDLGDGVTELVRLPGADRHRQPEGLEQDAAGALLVADEGRKRKGRLSVYR